jgi:hypothetical protein
MYGGVSQVDTWDPKPELTRRSGQPMPDLEKDPLFKVRNPGTLLGSTRTFAQAGESGIPVCDMYPNLAGCVDHLAVIRSMYADSFAHGSGLLQMNTGYLRQGFPSVGSWLTYGLGSPNQNLPGYVVMLDPRGGPTTGAPNWSSGYMPAEHQGTLLRTAGEPILNLKPPAGTSREMQRREIDFINELNTEHQAAHPGYSELAARIASYELAFRLQATAPEAPAAPLAQVIRVLKRQPGGRLVEIDYWCDICSIPMFTLKPCECCQGETRLRERPVKDGSPGGD